MSEVVLGFVGGIIVAILGYTATLLVARWGVGYNEKQLFVQTVTHERAVWRQDLRNATCQLIKSFSLYLGDQSPENFCALQEQRVAIKLRINPIVSPKHPLDAQILKLLEVFSDRSKISDPEVSSVASQLENAVQRLLKQEWEKSKREAGKGKFEAGAQV